VNARKCLQIVTKINQVRFSSRCLHQVPFSGETTRSSRSDGELLRHDETLPIQRRRRMKEMSIVPSAVIIVTSSLTKDMTGDSSFSSEGALTSSIHLMRRSPEIVKRWVNKVQEAVNHENIMIQYPALGLLYQIRRTDKHGIRKLIAKFSKYGLRSPYAYCFLVRPAPLTFVDSNCREFDERGRRRVMLNERSSHVFLSLFVAERTVRCTISSIRV
jgi:coatomer subunit gamma